VNEGDTKSRSSVPSRRDALDWSLSTRENKLQSRQIRISLRDLLGTLRPSSDVAVYGQSILS
jgi:hypothetical protein